MKTPLHTLAALTLLPAAVHAAAIGITIDSGGKQLQDEAGVALSPGVLATARDGAQVLLGYYPGATAAAPFGAAGTGNASFVRLTGPGTPFGVNFTVGDLPHNFPIAGELFVDSFSINTGVADALLPPVGMPLVLRIYNRSSEGNSTFLTELANPTFWSWVLPATPPSTLNINFDDSGLLKRVANSRTPLAITAGQSGLRTDEVVPEPATALLALSGLGLLASCRRR
jgi:hypothetical protein